MLPPTRQSQFMYQQFNVLILCTFIHASVVIYFEIQVLFKINTAYVLGSTPFSTHHLVLSFNFTMSGAATTAATSKFSSFMNHPAGELTAMHRAPGTRCNFFRTEDCILLGTVDEVVSCRSWFEGPFTAC